MMNIDAQQKAIIAAGAALAGLAASTVAAGIYLSDADNRAKVGEEAGKVATAVCDFFGNLNPFNKPEASAAAVPVESTADPAAELARAIADLQGFNRLETRDHARACTVMWEPQAGGPMVATGFDYPSKPDKCWVEFSDDPSRRFVGADAVKLLAVGKQVDAAA